jgi:hypothetical protein
MEQVLSDQKGFEKRLERTCRAMATDARTSARKQRSEMAKSSCMRHKQDIKLDGFVQHIRVSPLEGLTASMILVPVCE